MNEPFNLPVIYQGEAQEYKARFERYGYTHRFSVLIGEDTVVFEPDEEGCYRVIGQQGPVNLSLLQVVADKLRSLVA